MTWDDICTYFRRFLRRFVRNASADQWCQWEDTFLRKDGSWAGNKSISVDMSKQCLMRQIRESSCIGSGDCVRSAPRKPSSLGVAPPGAVISARQADFLVSTELR